MSHITLRHYHSTLGYIRRDSEQASLFKKRQAICKNRHEEGCPEPESVSRTRRKIKSALREFIKGGLV